MAFAFSEPWMWKNKNALQLIRVITQQDLLVLLLLATPDDSMQSNENCEKFRRDLKTAIEWLSKFTVARILFLQSLLTCFQIRILNPVHSWVCLIHKRFKDSLILDSLWWEHNLDEILWRDPVQLQIACKPLHNTSELDFGIGFGRDFWLHLDTRVHGGWREKENRERMIERDYTGMKPEFNYWIISSCVRLRLSDNQWFNVRFEEI